MADLLLAARGGARVPWRAVAPADPAGAYAVQDAVAARLGPVGGWKVGAANPEAVPNAAPCPAACLRGSGAVLDGPEWRLRGIEAEVGLRLGRDLDGAAPRAELAAAVEAVLPVIEVVETRLDGWGEADPLARLADLQSHGALILGPPSRLDPAALDLRTVAADLSVDGRAVAATRGGNPAEDVWRLLAWLADHAAARGRPLRAGQVVTTGSCTGMLFCAQGTRVAAELAGIGAVAMRF
ncbi:Hydratase/decarboxylase [Methylobacterium sp. 4-46]|uniref:2-keto-4-pentenoate hydratase n=1 Tax=unclassified Methylobacterium TaxID=2615210 RepID=UPI000165C608|nr:MULTISPECIES: fumarylacetoacetate hydrolase family protein [Methylobacterium]ACA18296.1 Hydratase/decarboxylase [Methylobacterium sp. 4-46]WFT77595.1 fumarylacetoacetate hydrolase family protein [Methylobacterium nodulans]